ncbi:LGFP repeat-containing protein [Nocardia sp. NPDC058519]|uniref:LGFP repeat-containing protein n=1 Tax=unclassified Nocardia TaxID=2637762 RepID=UPI003663D341
MSILAHYRQRAENHRRSRILAIGGMTVLAFGLLGPAPSVLAQPSQDAVSAIDDRYESFGGSGSLLGQPLEAATELSGGAERAYTGGYIYYSPDTGARVMYGAIGDKYRALGGPEGSLGYPTNDESATSDGAGRFNDFAAPGGAAIYWNEGAQAWVVKGPVLGAWRASGDVAGPFGYPTADMVSVEGVDTGQFAGPEGTEINWSEAGGLATVPAALAATLPGFRAGAPNVEGNVPVPTPAPAAAPVVADDPGINKWWALPIGLAIAALAGGLMAMIGRRRPTADITSPAHARGFTAAPATPAPPRFDRPVTPKPAPPVPPKVAAPRVTESTERLRPNTIGKVDTGQKRSPIGDEVRRAPLDRAAAPAMGHIDDLHSGEIPVTYENNAVGANQRSADDKSDPHRR